MEDYLSRLTLRQGTRDEITWKWTNTGIFTVKTAHTTLKIEPRLHMAISKIWKVRAPPRIKIFAWLAIKNRILTHDNLQKRGWEKVSRCLLCHEDT